MFESSVINIGTCHLSDMFVIVTRSALNDIFDMMDLSCNDSWSFEEFKLYNFLTGGEELEDSEWQVVEGQQPLSFAGIFYLLFQSFILCIIFSVSQLFSKYLFIVSFFVISYASILVILTKTLT